MKTTLNQLNERRKIVDSGEQLVCCSKCNGTNISISENYVSDCEHDYIAACMDCDEDMFLIELYYIKDGKRHRIESV